MRDGEILIRVLASSVNPFDCAARAGYLRGWVSYELPLILGLDISGIIEETGAGANGFAPGDEVYARAVPTINGAYAEFISVPASEAALKPPSLDHTQAASLANAGIAAWRTLVDAADLGPGQTILIHGAAGGVGSLAVQLAHWRGARVIGTASPNNHEFLRGLGVETIVDYNTTRFEDVAKNVDVVLDTVGGETQERSWSVLKPGGLLISIVQAPSDETAAEHGVRARLVSADGPAGEVLSEISSLVQAGQLSPVVTTTLPLEDIHKAHTMIEGRHTRGKIAIKI